MSCGDRSETEDLETSETRNTGVSTQPSPIDPGTNYVFTRVYGDLESKSESENAFKKDGGLARVKVRLSVAGGVLRLEAVVAIRESCHGILDSDSDEILV